MDTDGNESTNNFNNKKTNGFCKICNSECVTKCSNCSIVYYCSADHQKQDWSTHKKLCHPFQVQSNDKVGRYLVASRTIAANEIVLKEYPLICGPSQMTSPVCLGCLQGLKEGNKLECSKCGWPICSSNCENTKQHQDECSLTVARGSKVMIQHFFSPHPTYQCITPLRCLMLKYSDTEKWTTLSALESHEDERRGTAQWLNDREGIAKFIPRFFKCSNKWTEEEIMKVSGIVQINGHEVPLTDPPHVAIYQNASLIEHSCLPNLTKAFSKKGELILWAPNRIEIGEHLSICYSDAIWGTLNRQHHLKQTKMFQCQCPRCTDLTEMGTNFSAVKCNRKDVECSGLALPKSLDKLEDEWMCNKCNQGVTYKYVENILDRAGKDLEAMQKEDEISCRKYITHYTKWLPLHHYYITDVRIALIQIIGSGSPTAIQNISEEVLNEKIEICQDLIKLLYKLAPAEARLLGTIHFELHAALAEFGRRASANKNNNYRGALEESLRNAEEAIRLLDKEPTTLSEGQICAQAKVNKDSLNVLLEMLQG